MASSTSAGPLSILKCYYLAFASESFVAYYNTLCYQSRIGQKSLVMDLSCMLRSLILKLLLVFRTEVLLDMVHAVHADTRRRPKQYRPVTANSARHCANPGPGWSHLDPLQNELGP